MDTEILKQGCYPIRMNYLPEIFYQKASEELNETPETREKELQKLIDLLSDDESSADIKFEVDFLHQFLRHRKYNSSTAFLYVKKYLQFRRNYSSLFLNISDEYLDAKPDSKLFTVLPHRSPDGCAILITRLGNWNLNEYSTEDIKIWWLAALMQLLRSPMTQISGLKVIHDCRDTAKLLRQCTPQNISVMYNIAFNCSPIRYKEVHCINKSLVMTAIWSVIKHILSEKMRKRILFHSKPEDLLNYFPSSIIPPEYGGSLKNYHDQELTKMLIKDHGNCPIEGQPNYS